MEVELLLEGEGATSFAFAATEAQAVACAIKRRPDLITSDVKLAEGTGPHAVSEIQRLYGEIPVIFITGSASECDPCEPPGVVLTKPINNQALIKAFHARQL